MFTLDPKSGDICQAVIKIVHILLLYIKETWKFHSHINLGSRWEFYSYYFWFHSLQTFRSTPSQFELVFMEMGEYFFFFDWQGKEKLFIENNALPQRPRTPNSETQPSQPHSLVPLLGYSWSYCFFERPMGSVRSKLLVALFQMSGCSIFLLLYLWMQYYSGTTGKLLLNVVSCSWIIIVIIGQH